MEVNKVVAIIKYPAIDKIHHGGFSIDFLILPRDKKKLKELQKLVNSWNSKLSDKSNKYTLIIEEDKF